MKKQDTYSIIASQIIEALESGTRPWIECYDVSKNRMPVSVRNVEYTGTNRMLLSFQQYRKGFASNVWLTFNEIKKLGANVKGQKGSMGIFWKTATRKNKQTNKDEDYMFAKRFTLFNTDQISDLPSDYMDKFKNPDLIEYENSPIERAESFIANIPHICEERDCIPCYIPSLDIIRMPNIKQFKTPEQYYATYLHELGHHTKKSTRLDRNFKLGSSDENRAAEELTVELSAAFLLPSIGIEPLIDEEHSSYISSFLSLLKNQPKIFVTACSHAEKIANYLKSFQEQEESKQVA